MILPDPFLIWLVDWGATIDQSEHFQPLLIFIFSLYENNFAPFRGQPKIGEGSYYIQTCPLAIFE